MVAPLRPLASAPALRGRVPSPGTARHAGAPVRKTVKPAKLHDGWSILVAVLTALAAAMMVAAVWYYTHKVDVPPVRTGGLAAGDGTLKVDAPFDPNADALATKRTHFYWKETYGTFHHYYNDPVTGRMVDAGVMTVEEMLKQGLDVPGYVMPHQSTMDSDELKRRFQSIQDHLN